MNERNIMHRDLKPENLLFKIQNDYSTITIADFGLATFINLKKFMFTRCGTPGYVAPEVINIKDENKIYGPECDIYSLGIIFHLLLLRKSPFDGNSFK